jgi:8-oxo-dGTP diphosphatase
VNLNRATAKGTTQQADAAELERQRVGVGVMVVRNGEVLFGRRRGAHGAGTWSLPGGHLDDGESAEAGALRELIEETGLDAANPRLIGETEDVFPEGLRFRTLCVRLDWAGGRSGHARAARLR